ncbi:gamma-glutamyltransferase family protein [Sulfolobus tengchongensis]|uniref:Gamma-glutamyltransferase family protein n=1 Tax=Sulfolobus tengchongensis TaxID=207809 RepID=A0AAX4KWZ6_9CREN
MNAIATDHFLASKAGIEMFKKGGNAFDAITASAAVLSVVDPYNSGLGGFGVAILRTSDGKIRGVNFIGTAPRRLKLEDLIEEDPWEDYKPTAEGPLSPLVPGNVAGWGEIHSKYGQLKWADVLEPAILAARGHEITNRIHKFYEGIKWKAARHQSTYKTFYSSGSFPSVGEILKQPELENTLKILAEEGWESFYNGTLASRISDAVRKWGGVLDEEDLKSYSLLWVNPLNTTFEKSTIYSLSQGTGGPIVLEWLNIIEQLNPQDSWDSGNFAHFFLEAGKLAMRDDDAYNSGKNYITMPVDKLISKEHAKELAALITNKANFYKKVNKSVYGLHTTSLSAIDDEGNAVTMTLTQMYGFDRNGLLEGLGFSLNDGVCYFSTDPKDKERVEPMQRPRYPLSPIIAENQNELITLGSAGGWTIPQTITLTLLKILKFNMEIDKAIVTPRYILRYRDNSIPYPPGTVVEIEEGIPRATIEELRNRGHIIGSHTPFDKAPFGAVNGVQAMRGKMIGGAEIRRDGIALTI